MDGKFIKLKSKYSLFLNDENHIYIYDKLSEKVILNINASKITSNINASTLNRIKYFSLFEELTKTLEGLVILKIYKANSSIFDVEVNTTPIINNWIDEEYDNVIDYTNFYSTFPDDKGNVEFVIWGIDEITLTITKVLNTINAKVTYIYDPLYENNIDTVKFLKKNEFQNINQYFETFSNYKNLEILEFEDFKRKNSNLQIVHILSTKLLKEMKIKSPKIETDFSIFYGIYTNHFIVGPLTVDNKFDYPSMIEKHLGNNFSFSTYVSTQIISGFLIRILYFLNKGALKYLANDAQLPLNQIYMFDKYTLSAKTIDLEKPF